MARRRSRAGSEETEAELDLTPMLDVVFILLIFFIVTAVFVKEPGAEVVRPETELLEENLKPTLLIAVTSENEIHIDNAVYEMDQVRNVLERLLQENPKAEAMIQADQGSEIGTVLDIQKMLTEDLEVDDVKISTDQA